VNRLIAEEMQISIKTVEAHRARIMEKLAVDSVAELVQATLGARPPGGAGGGAGGGASPAG
jgi:FixJ family two-component response regulator